MINLILNHGSYINLLVLDLISYQRLVASLSASRLGRVVSPRRSHARPGAALRLSYLWLILAEFYFYIALSCEQIRQYYHSVFFSDTGVPVARPFGASRQRRRVFELLLWREIAAAFWSMSVAVPCSPAPRRAVLALKYWFVCSFLFSSLDV